MILFCFRFIPQYGMGLGLWKSMFISVSAFCNAGFDLFGSTSLSMYRSDILINITVMILTIFGGLGFIVVDDIIERYKDRKKSKYSFNKMLSKFSLQTKIVLWMTIILIFVGTFGIFFMEYDNPKTIKNLPVGEKIMVSAFQSVNSRTTGMSTVKMFDLKDSSKILISILMMIGGAPGSTSGGIKTVTFAVIFLMVMNSLMGRKRVIIGKKEIDNEIAYKSIAVAFISILLVSVSTMILTITDPKIATMDLLFEVVSALGTVGLSVGATPILSIAGKIIVTVLMYIGRVTTVTMALAIFVDKSKENENIRYPNEKLIVG